jgi:hypothetical protein
MDFRNRANSNYLSNIVSESGSTNFVQDLVRLEAEAAGGDLFLDLGGAAEDRLGGAEPPELTSGGGALRHARAALDHADALGISHEYLRWAWPLAARATHDLADTDSTRGLLALLDGYQPG